MMLWILIALAILLAIWFVGAWYVRGPDLGYLDEVANDQPPPSRGRFSSGTTQNAEHRAVGTWPCCAITWTPCSPTAALTRNSSLSTPEE